MNEEWFLQLTLYELRYLSSMLSDESGAVAGGEQERADNVAKLRDKVDAVIATAENWETPLSEIVNTPSRGELPDA